MQFFARLLLSLFCLVTALAPVIAAVRMAPAAVTAEHHHGQHSMTASHGGPVSHEAADQAACDDCRLCLGHCLPMMTGIPGMRPGAWAGTQPGTAPSVRAGITAPPELKPPRP